MRHFFFSQLPLPSSSKLSISYSFIYHCMLWNQSQVKEKKKKQRIPIISFNPNTWTRKGKLSNPRVFSMWILLYSSILLVGFCGCFIFCLICDSFLSFFEFRMGPIRGFKRKKKAEKKFDQNVLAAAAASSSSLQSQPQPLDWWDEFSQRISGNTFLWYLLIFLVEFVHCHCS